MREPNHRGPRCGFPEREELHLKVNLDILQPRGVGKTAIEWADFTANPVRARHHGSDIVGWHCEPVSEGCKFCYAEALNRFRGTQLGYTRAARANVEHVLDRGVLLKVLKLRAARPGIETVAGDGRWKIFWGDMSDLFGEWVRDEWLDEIFATCALRPDIDHLFLTKRLERMREYVARPGTRDAVVCEALKTSWGERGAGLREPTRAWPLPNVWLGASVENQPRAEERIPLLLRCPAAKRFLSVEPLLGAVDLFAAFEPFLNAEVQRSQICPPPKPVTCETVVNTLQMALDWVICGGESGPGARVMHPDWARSVREQCQAAGVPLFFKQWGEWAPAAAKLNFTEAEQYADGRPYEHHSDGSTLVRVGKKAAGHRLDGVELREWPATAVPA